MVIAAAFGFVLLSVAPAQAVTATTIRPASSNVLFAGIGSTGGPRLIATDQILASPDSVRWVFHEVNRGTDFHGFTIQNRSSRKCLVGYNDGRLDMRPCDGAPGYLFTWRFSVGQPPRAISPHSPYATVNWVRIRSNQSGRCLGIAMSAQYVPNTPLGQYVCGAATRVSWRLFNFAAP